LLQGRDFGGNPRTQQQVGLRAPDEAAPLALPHGALLRVDPPPRRRKKTPVSGHSVLPGPGGKTTTVEGRQRPQLKAAPGSDETLTEASAGAHVIDPVTGTGVLDSARSSSTRWPDDQCSGQPAAQVQGRDGKLEKTPRRDSNPGFELRHLGCSPLRYSNGAIVGGRQWPFIYPLFDR
jgi:hypothetical protein